MEADFSCPSKMKRRLKILSIHIAAEFTISHLEDGGNQNNTLGCSWASQLCLLSVFFQKDSHRHLDIMVPKGGFLPFYHNAAIKENKWDLFKMPDQNSAPEVT